MYISTPKNSSILAWEIPWTENPGRLQFMGWQRVRHDWVTTQLAHWGIELLKKTTFTPFLPVFYKVIEKKKPSKTLFRTIICIYTYILEKAMAPHSSTLAWKIPWTEEPRRLQSMGSWRVGHDWATSLSLFTFMHWRRKWQPTPCKYMDVYINTHISLCEWRIYGPSGCL